MSSADHPEGAAGREIDARQHTLDELLAAARLAAGGKYKVVVIHGHAVTVPAGTSVMRAAAMARTQIPKLCATDTLKAFGSCRV